jgi:hypothetical protein
VVVQVPVLPDGWPAPADGGGDSSLLCYSKGLDVRVEIPVEHPQHGKVRMRLYRL